ncbi:MAG: EAL domain-containing protein [Alphaproteobacteria bacterium]|nr:EAL domain-containing protein [Alphaproteobacteria bacterium]MCD8570014.1 EAL domain-containing protein [Alphaproteobacteria bacterium]
MNFSNEKKSIKAGDIIMRQGEPGHAAYIIESGRVEIVLEQPGGKAQSVGTRGAGTIIGEMAIVDNAPRTATVRAIEDCELLEITADDFGRRLNAADPVLKMTTQVILTRYRDMLTRADISRDSLNWPPPESLELDYAQSSDALANIKIANEFKEALNHDEISLHYQPIINLQTGEVAGFEALMRWFHPEKGFISPGIFIPVIEESGLIVLASRWALREACLALKRIENRAGYLDRKLFMGVNFSSHDFASEDFVDGVYTTISESDVDPSQVHLEITERLLIHQPDNAKETLEMCRKAGMSIAIDDFGTGYSSLSYLHYFPIDTLKIDQSFVRDMTKNDASLELVKSIISLGKNMKMKVIAEGVEHKEEGLLLRDLGCDLAQGYYFARPAAEKDVTELVKNWDPAEKF